MVDLIVTQNFKFEAGLDSRANLSVAIKWRCRSARSLLLIIDVLFSREMHIITNELCRHI